MRRKNWLVASVVVLGLSLLVGACWKPEAVSTSTSIESEAGGKTITLKLLLPQDDALVKVDGKEVEGKGSERKLTVTTAKDKDYVLVTAFWEPNNYTKITRPRKVTAKDGEVVVDFIKRSDKELDDIVVRWVPTPPEFVDGMCKMAKVGKDDIVYDLGCGDGIMVFTAVKKFGAKRGVGIDIDEDLIKKCKTAAAEAKLTDRVEFRVGDVLKVKDLSDATVVLLYMGDDINERLKPILQKTLKPGARVVSHRFLMGDDWPPDRSEEIECTVYPGTDSRYEYKNKIHLWEIKKK
jgi:uncharacterized protein (TIGR03000 family)